MGIAGVGETGWTRVGSFFGELFNSEQRGLCSVSRVPDSSGASCAWCIRCVCALDKRPTHTRSDHRTHSYARLTFRACYSPGPFIRRLCIFLLACEQHVEAQTPAIFVVSTWMHRNQRILLRSQARVKLHGHGFPERCTGYSLSLSLSLSFPPFCLFSVWLLFRCFVLFSFGSFFFFLFFFFLSVCVRFRNATYFSV